MTKEKRARGHAQAQADKLAESVGLRGWIIVAPGGTWFGPFWSKAAAASRVGRLDSLNMKITGVVVEAK